ETSYRVEAHSMPGHVLGRELSAQHLGGAMPDEAMPNEESAQLPIRVAGESLHVRRVFGEPYEFDGAVLVPVAKVMGGTGMGYGSGTLGPDEHKSTTQHGEGDGGGGGFGVRTKPVGAYRIKDGDVTWLPAFDL